MAIQCNIYNLEANFKTHLKDKRYSRTSIANYSADVKRYLSWLTRELDKEHLEENITQFTQESVSSYIDTLYKKHIPLSTINRTLSSLRQFSQYCVDQGCLETNPLKNMPNMKSDRIKSIDDWIRSNKRSLLAFGIGFSFIMLALVVPIGLVDSGIASLISTSGKTLNQELPNSQTMFASSVASTSADLLTIPIIDQQGNLNLSAPYPSIVGSSGTLTLTAPQLSLKSQAEGSITLNSNLGSMLFQFEGQRPELPYDSAFYFSGENMTSGTLLYARTPDDTGAVTMFELSSGSPAESKFRVDSQGNVYVKGNIILEGNLIVNPESIIFGNVSGNTATSSASPTFIEE